ncbi:MAG: hypothetical protein D6798_20480 [Deltaproteobacteria bacterium]|nr:MAG: hypothetical protein D6798_20480 [Deltaproteobacteria bacterium]
MDQRTYNFHVLIHRSETAPHIWVAHCLELGLVSQADSPAAARDAIEEAVTMIVLDDLNAGLDPLDRQPSEEKYQQMAKDLFERGRTVDLSQDDVADREQVSRFLVLLQLSFEKEASPGGKPRAAHLCELGYDNGAAA